MPFLYVLHKSQLLFNSILFSFGKTNIIVTVTLHFYWDFFIREVPYQKESNHQRRRRGGRRFCRHGLPCFKFQRPGQAGDRQDRAGGHRQTGIFPQQPRQQPENGTVPHHRLCGHGYPEYRIYLFDGCHPECPLGIQLFHDALRHQRRSCQGSRYLTFYLHAEDRRRHLKFLHQYPGHPETQQKNPRRAFRK